MDEVQAKKLVETYSDMILRIGLHYFGQVCDAEDICQNVFLKMIREKRLFDSPEHEKAWIIRVTINECKNRLRSSYYRKTVRLEDCADLPEPFIENEKSGVWQAVRDLPRNYRLSIYLYYYEGYSAGEIGKMMGKNENTVAAYLSRGRKKLRRILEEEESKGGYEYAR